MLALMKLVDRSTSLMEEKPVGRTGKLHNLYGTGAEGETSILG
jgi:hypothetical protein